MFDDDDPFLAELRTLALEFPESVELETWGRPTFRAGKRIFALYGGSDERPRGVFIKPEPDDVRALQEDPRFYAPPYFGPSGWLSLDFDFAPVDWDEVRELLDGSYRQVALKRMIRSLDDDGPSS